MDVIGDLVARDRRTDDLAVRTDSRSGSYSYEAFCTNAWKAGNLLRHYGVRGGATVAVDAGDSGDGSGNGDTGDDATVPPLLALAGSALLGARVRFDPPNAVDADALVAPARRIDRYDPAPGTQALAYGDVPDAAEVAHFEREAWSENPSRPPDAVDPEAVVLSADDRSYTHERLLSAARSVADEHDLDAGSEVVIRAPLSRPGTVVAGVLTPLLAGGTILLDRSQTGTVAVGSAGDGVVESTVLDPENTL